MGESTGTTADATTGDTKDVIEAWSCPANLRLYDDDPGPRAVNVASAEEPRWVDRREALVELYARRMLIACDADRDRVDSRAHVPASGRPRAPMVARLDGLPSPCVAR